MYIKFTKAENDYGYNVEIYLSEENNGVIWFNTISATMIFIASAFKETIDLNGTNKLMVKSGTKEFLERANKKPEEKKSE